MCSQQNDHVQKHPITHPSAVSHLERTQHNDALHLVVLAWWIWLGGFGLMARLMVDCCSPLSGFGASVLPEASKNLQLILPEERLLLDLQFHSRT